MSSLKPVLGGLCAAWFVERVSRPPEYTWRPRHHHTALVLALVGAFLISIVFGTAVHFVLPGNPDVTTIRALNKMNRTLLYDRYKQDFETSLATAHEQSKNIKNADLRNAIEAILPLYDQLDEKWTREGVTHGLVEMCELQGQAERSFNQNIKRYER